MWILIGISKYTTKIVIYTTKIADEKRYCEIQDENW